MKKRINFSSGTKWEKMAGYSRAVRLGNVVEVAGTTAVDENGNVIGEGDAYRQTIYILNKIGYALNQTGSKLEDVVRTRIYVKNMADWQDVVRAHGEVFKDILPATTLVEVCALINPKLIVEIEAKAVVQDE
jgi:enamine deaminase RidA (YjgF/YER057c/UK114 family)